MALFKWFRREPKEKLLTKEEAQAVADAFQCKNCRNCAMLTVNIRTGLGSVLCAVKPTKDGIRGLWDCSNWKPAESFERGELRRVRELKAAA
jgi:hypothetical protein